jgi:hypothetical protein
MLTTTEVDQIAIDAGATAVQRVASYLRLCDDRDDARRSIEALRVTQPQLFRRAVAPTRPRSKVRAEKARRTPKQEWER